LLNLSQGVIVVTGPTGSGKTTTLYGLLNKLKSPDINITTVEDPIEYRLDGINQVQVNDRQG
jgi:type II secretory ATPase GspE/PulE/Tfp pilus assembly ATPase PilB-like protein